MGKVQVRIGTVGIALILAIGALTAPLAFAAAPTVGLGTADSFAVLAGAGITNTGPTTINGDVGSHPTTTQIGFTSVTLTGTNHFGDAVTQGAKTDLVTAYNNAAGRTPVTTVPTELGGTTLTAGTYTATSGTFGLTGTVTLNGQGDPTSVFIFQMASSLTTAGSSSVSLIGSAQSCNVFWQVGSSATLGGSTSFKGTIMALTSITLVTGATIDGRALARNGAVTLDTNTITKSTCAAATPAPVGLPGGATSTPGPTLAPTPAPMVTAGPITTAAPTAAPIVTPRPAPTATPAAPVATLPSTSTLDRSGPLTLVGLLLALIGALILRSRRSAPTIR